MRTLEEWDEEYLEQVADAKFAESVTLEKKAAAKFALDAKDKVTGETKKELAKQVCAFANAGEGFLVYGIRDGGGLDEGVSSAIGRQPVTDWVEAVIPKLHHPPIGGCEARFIRDPNHHQVDRGVLIVAVPLSERRPHWTRDPEKAYLRVGAHSDEMRPQTLLDLFSRLPAVGGVELHLEKPEHLPGYKIDPRGGGFGLDYCIRFEPWVTIDSGPVVKDWFFEISMKTTPSAISMTPVGQEDPPKIINPGRRHNVLSYNGNHPLFPGRRNYLLIEGGILAAFKENDANGQHELQVSFFASNTPPVMSEFALIVSDRGVSITKR